MFRVQRERRGEERFCFRVQLHGRAPHPERVMRVCLINEFFAAPGIFGPDVLFKNRFYNLLFIELADAVDDLEEHAVFGVEHHMTEQFIPVVQDKEGLLPA